MYDTDDAVNLCYRPYDVVSDKKGNVGFISEVSINECQQTTQNQLQYSICWLTGSENKVAWFTHNELIVHSNIFDKIARISCHPSGNGSRMIHKTLWKDGLSKNKGTNDED